MELCPNDQNVKTSDFDYDLPESYIAQTPVEPRDSSRLLVLHRDTGTREHRIFRDILDYLHPGDLLIANESRVIPARLQARKIPTGGQVEILLLTRRDELTWEVLVRGRKTPVGTRLALYEHDTAPVGAGLEARPVLEGEIVAWTEEGERLIRWDEPIDLHLDRLGIVPLPPYIHAPIPDPERYQTVYAHKPGSVAAPTAGLHFTPELLLAARDRGVQIAFVDLDIGLDTFRPVETENVQEHHIHTEHASLDPEVARQINQAKLEGRRVIAVGTTSVRVLETAALRALDASQGAGSHLSPRRGGPPRLPGRGGPPCPPNQSKPLCTPGRGGPPCPPPSSQISCGWQTVSAFSGPTDLFIYPGFQFRVVDALITNFHLPRSSLLMLVSAFAGRELVLEAYREAVEKGYRFFSFGDAMLIL